MDLTYDSDGSEEETQVKPTRKTQAPSLEDEEAFPDFGNASMPAAPSAQNWSAAWSSSKAPQEMPQPVSKPRRRAPAEAPRAAPMADAHSTTETRSGGGVSWNESAWSTNAAKENKATWGERKNTHYEQAFKSAGACEDPFVPKNTAFSTAPKAKAKQAVQAAAAPAASTTSKEATAEPPTKAARPAKKTSKDSDGFTEVVSHKKSEEKKGEKETKSTAKVLGAKSAFSALDDNRDGEKESGGKKKGKQEKKKEKKAEDAIPIPEVQVNTAPKKKKKAAKAKEEEDFGAALAEDKKKGTVKKKKGSAAAEPASGLPLGVVGAALIGVAGLMFYFAQQVPVVSK